MTYSITSTIIVTIKTRHYHVCTSCSIITHLSSIVLTFVTTFSMSTTMYSSFITYLNVIVWWCLFIVATQLTISHAAITLILIFMTIVVGDLNYPVVYLIVILITCTIGSITPTHIAPVSTLLSSHPVTLLIPNYLVVTYSHSTTSHSINHPTAISSQPAIYSHPSITYSLSLSLLLPHSSTSISYIPTPTIFILFISSTSTTFIII